MAEGFACVLHREHSFFSAGIEAHGLNPHAVAVMREAGVDISRHESKSIDKIDLDEIDLVITVCGHADETCPVLPGRTPKIHLPFPDPPKLAEAFDDTEQKLDQYRLVRDDIRRTLETLNFSA